MSLASDQGQVSLLCLPVLKESKFGNGGRERSHVEICQWLWRRWKPPPLCTATGPNGVTLVRNQCGFEPRGQRSASPTLNHGPSWCSIAGERRDTDVEPDWWSRGFRPDCLANFPVPVNEVMKRRTSDKTSFLSVIRSFLLMNIREIMFDPKLLVTLWNEMIDYIYCEVSTSGFWFLCGHLLWSGGIIFVYI